MTVDLSPLYRTAIGFDRLASMLENANRLESAGYPPYNIEVTGKTSTRSLWLWLALPTMNYRLSQSKTN